jgi:hypothetical protein
VHRAFASPLCRGMRGSGLASVAVENFHQFRAWDIERPADPPAPSGEPALWRVVESDFSLQHLHIRNYDESTAKTEIEFSDHSALSTDEHGCLCDSERTRTTEFIDRVCGDEAEDGKSAKRDGPPAIEQKDRKRKHQQGHRDENPAAARTARFNPLQARYLAAHEEGVLRKRIDESPTTATGSSVCNGFHLQSNGSVPWVRWSLTDKFGSDARNTAALPSRK